VVESAVIGLPHPDFGEAVAAVVVASRDAPPAPEAIVEELRGQIANFKVPKAVFVVGDLPRNAMGKVQKNLLRERYAATFEAS
jgi:malonyl-CoA/methylmalonyl-CoA synthetase